MRQIRRDARPARVYQAGRSGSPIRCQQAGADSSRLLQQSAYPRAGRSLDAAPGCDHGCLGCQHPRTRRYLRVVAADNAEAVGGSGKAGSREPLEPQGGPWNTSCQEAARTTRLPPSATLANSNCGRGLQVASSPPGYTQILGRTGRQLVDGYCHRLPTASYQGFSRLPVRDNGWYRYRGRALDSAL